MKIIRKFGAVFMVIAMMFSLVACGTKETTTSAPETETKVTPTVAVAADNGAADTSNDGSQETASSDAVVIKSTGPHGEKAVPATSLSLTDAEKQQIKDGKYTAAVSLHYGGNDWSTSQLKGLTDTFNDLGIEIVATTDADFSAEQQVSDLETIMAKNPDILVSIPTDATSTADAYRRVSEAGTKIVFMDNVPQGFVAGTDYVSCVSADNYGNGIIAADLIGEALNGEGKIGVINYDVDFFVTNQRLEAFEKEMAEKYPNIEIVSKMGFTDQNACSEVADAMILNNPDLDAIFAHWDVPAEGVLSSLRAAGLNNIKLSTIDLGNNIAKEIAEGTVLGVGAQLPYDQGVAEATLAAYALLGKETPAYVAVPAMRVDQNNILEAYQTVYHVPAPDWLVSAARK